MEMATMLTLCLANSAVIRARVPGRFSRKMASCFASCIVCSAVRVRPRLANGVEQTQAGMLTSNTGRGQGRKGVALSRTFWQECCQNDHNHEFQILVFPDGDLSCGVVRLRRACSGNRHPP